MLEHPSVLVVDDDQGTRETFSWALQRGGFTVHTAASGEQALQSARSSAFDLLLVDLWLPDMLGTALIGALGATPRLPRFMLMSGFLSTRWTVQAVKLGAFDVLEKPIDIDRLPEIVRSALDGPRERRQIAQAPARGAGEPGSNAERWAFHVLKGCQSAIDPKAMQLWARSVGVSRTTLCENCRLLGLRPHDARDFVRMLRAVMQSQANGCPPEAVLDVSDRRTLDHLRQKAGLDRAGGTVQVEEFLRTQRFVPYDHPGLRTLRTLL
jgi:DNA-binding response OmpR family regulator